MTRPYATAALPPSPRRLAASAQYDTGGWTITGPRRPVQHGLADVATHRHFNNNYITGTSFADSPSTGVDPRKELLRRRPIQLEPLQQQPLQPRDTAPSGGP